VALTLRSRCRGELIESAQQALSCHANSFVLARLVGWFHGGVKTWAKMDNTFLSELPALVKVPRLAAPDLKDPATTKTAALLATVIVPDDMTVASKWSNAPKLNKPPAAAAAVTVNCSDTNCPARGVKKRLTKAQLQKQ
jgi:hypothetical protein